VRVWLRRQGRSLHELNEAGTDTSCLAVQLKCMNLERYERTGKPLAGERICQACQTAIAERRGKF
jgi:hypothetical protein